MKRFITLFLILFLLLTPIFSIADYNPSPQQPINPQEIEEIIEEHQPIFRLTIHYIYKDGTIVFPDYIEQLNIGTLYKITSPEVINYIPNIKIIEDIMPPRNVEYTVIYLTDQTIIIEDYEVPLGVGNTFMNIGICIE